MVRNDEGQNVVITDAISCFVVSVLFHFLFNFSPVDFEVVFNIFMCVTVKNVILGHV